MKVTVNGTELDLAPGTSAIDAVFAAGHDVPYFCSQEYMSPIGACRMCLAKIGAPRKDRDGSWMLDDATGEPKIFFFPTMMATCTTAVMEGMVIDTLSPDVKDAQNGMVEFTLINHPLDCPVCDKGGACELQDRAYEYGTGESRFVFDKRHQEKHHALSPLITLDRERCIHCKRCVRYFEEIPGDEVLDFIERGGHTYIGTADEGLPSNFTGNITDMCPVGALLDATSRFRGRNWEYDHTRSTSLDDPSGASVMIDARTGRIERIKAARNNAVNHDWLDDGSRFGHEYANAADRIKTPLLRQSDGSLQPATWQEAAAFIAERLATVEGKRFGVVLRADATLEEAVAAKALAAQLGSDNCEHFPRYPVSVMPDPARQASFDDLATSDAILVIADVSEEAPIVDLRIKDALKGLPPADLLPHGVPIADLRLKERMPRKKDILTVAAPYTVDLMRHAGEKIVYQPGDEAALLRSVLEQHNHPQLFARLQQAKNPVIVYGGFVLRSPEANQALQALAEATDAKLLAIGAMANSYGLEALGCSPAQSHYQQMLQGQCEALILSGLNPAADPDIAAQLQSCALLVAHTMFPSETTAIADVVLPAKSGYEKEGTMMNLEGRYLPVRAAPIDGGQAEDFMGVVRALGEAMGLRLAGRSLRSAHRELVQRYQLDLADLADEGRLAPLAPLARSPLPETKASATGLQLLLVPSMLRHEYLSRNPKLRQAHGDTALRMHPTDASAHQLSDGATLRLRVGGMWREAQLRLSDSLPPGLCLLPVLPEQPVALLRLEPEAIETLTAEVVA